MAKPKLDNDRTHELGDLSYQRNRLWLRLHEKGDKHYGMPAHHNLQFYLRAYLGTTGICDEKKPASLFRAIDKKTKKLSGRRLERVHAWSMARCRAAKAGISTEICNHTFRVTGMTAYLGQWRPAGDRGQYGRPFLDAHDPTLRSAL